MTITTKIVYALKSEAIDFQNVEFSLTSTESSIEYKKYDIRVCHPDEVIDGSGGRVSVAITTKTTHRLFTLSSAPTLFPIPTKSTMTNGALYTATIRVCDASGVWVTLPTGEFYYDTRTFSVDPVHVSHSHIDGSHNFVTTSPVVRWDDGEVETPALLASDDDFFNYFRHDKVTMSCADVSREPNHVSTQYDLGEIVHGEEYVWNVNSLPSETAYELWGAISHALTAPSENSWTVDASNNYRYIVPEIVPSFDIVTSDTYGYNLANPTFTLTLGDVSGTISTDPIKFVIDNISSYEVHPFQSITFELKDVSNNSTLFSNTFDASGNEYIVSATDLETAVDAGLLVNGELYNCKITLNFTDTSYYSPPQSRSTEVQDTFEDLLEPIDVASVVNSWQENPAEIHGLVISFMKTNQFLGNDSEFPANLDAFGNTYVLAEYSVYDNDNDEWSGWQTLDGGSISQGAITYDTNQNANEGLYLIPKHTSNIIGSVQDPVYIYAEIPDQDQYKLVKVKLTLQTDNTSFAVNKRASEPMYVDRVSTAIYPVADASFRYFPKPAAHDFDTDKPIIDSIDINNNVLFLVPVSVPPFFSSEVVGANGTASVVSNDTFNVLSDDVDGLSYLPENNSSFVLTVSYVSDENPVIYTAPTSMTVQKQGFPSDSFDIAASSWDMVNQEIDYTLHIRATATSVDRMDGWNLSTKLSSAPDTAFVSHGNLLITNETLTNDTITQSVDLSGNYPDYSLIDVKFVATRSRYLASDNYESQVETVDVLLDSESTQITTLPDMALPRPVAADITLSNTIYNSLTPLTTPQYATLSVTLPENVIGVRYRSVPPGSTTNYTRANASPINILLDSTPTTITYTIEFEYNSIVNGVNVSVYSDATTVSFSSGVSNRGAPVIVSKDRVSSTDFNVEYTSDNSGNYTNSVLTSDVYVNDNNVGTDNGSVNLSSYEGLAVVFYVKDSFSSTYTVDGSEYQTVQVINSPDVALILATNPAINETSLTITSSYLQFSVNNNGTPFIDRVLVVVAQDATTDENDLGTYSLAMFENTAGFTDTGSPSYANTLIGHEHTLSVIDISETGMAMTTLFRFTPESPFSSAPANVVIHVSNAVEGSDSCAIAELV
jgi:hypothetical protein